VVDCALSSGPCPASKSSTSIIIHACMILVLDMPFVAAQHTRNTEENIASNQSATRSSIVIALRKRTGSVATEVMTCTCTGSLAHCTAHSSFASILRVRATACRELPKVTAAMKAIKGKAASSAIAIWLISSAARNHFPKRNHFHE